jgi:hypothetical protein
VPNSKKKNSLFRMRTQFMSSHSKLRTLKNRGWRNERNTKILDFIRFALQTIPPHIFCYLYTRILCCERGNIERSGVHVKLWGREKMESRNACTMFDIWFSMRTCAIEILLLQFLLDMALKKENKNSTW